MHTKIYRSLAFVLAFQIGIGAHLPAAIAQEPGVPVAAAPSVLSAQDWAESFGGALDQFATFYFGANPKPLSMSEVLKSKHVLGEIVTSSGGLVMHSKAPDLLPAEFTYQVKLGDGARTVAFSVYGGPRREVLTSTTFTAAEFSEINLQDAPRTIFLRQMQSRIGFLKKIHEMAHLDRANQDFKNRAIDRHVTPNIYGAQVPPCLFGVLAVIAGVVGAAFIAGAAEFQGGARVAAGLAVLVAAAVVTNSLMDIGNYVSVKHMETVFGHATSRFQMGMDQAREQGLSDDQVVQVFKDRLSLAIHDQAEESGSRIPMFMALAAGLAGAVASIAGSRSYLLAFGIAAVTVSLVVIKKGLYADRNKAPSIEGIEVAVDREIDELFKTPDRK